MDWLRRSIEWYFGVPPAEPGQGTAWHLTAEAPWPSWMPQWTLLMLLLFTVGYIGYVYFRDSRNLPLRARATLILLRVSTVALIVALLSQLTLAIERIGLPFVALLIDNSASMGLEDDYAEKTLRAAAVEFTGKPTGVRLELVKSVLTQNDARFLTRLNKDHKLRIYRFSNGTTPVGRSEYVAGDSIDELLAELSAMEANGNATRPGPALIKVLNDFRGSPPSAIIVFTDGITTTGDADRLTTAAETARRKLVPVFTVGIGSEQPARDLQIYDALVDEVAFVDDPISFSAKLKGFGFEGTQVEVLLHEKSSKQILTSRTVRVLNDGRPLNVEITYTPPSPGEYDYVLEIKPLATELNANNNSETRHVSVREGKIRVLLADLYPRWEYRELKLLLEREKTIEIQTVLQDADPEYSDQDETAALLKGRFPVSREQLAEFDVVVFGDLNPRFMSAGIFDNLRHFVSEQGGGLIFIAGENYNPISYRGTPLDELLPIDLEDAQYPPAEIPLDEAFNPVLTPAGRKGTMIFRFTDDEAESIDIWRQLPGFYWMVAAPRLKPGTTVFVEHPSRAAQRGKLPVICMRRFGGGKIVFHATDELWRWRFQNEDRYYGRYWVQAIRYLSRSRLLGQSRTAELMSDRQVYRRGDVVSLRVRFLDERQVPSEGEKVTVVVERRGGAQRPVLLSALAQAPTVFEGQFRNAVEGAYHAFVSQPAFKEAPPAIDFRVEAPQRELQKRGLDKAELTQTAKLTRGRYYSLADIDQLPDEVPAGHPVPLKSDESIPLWNRWDVLLLIVLLLSTEWVLRKRWRLV